MWHSNWNLKPPEYLGIPEDEIDIKKLRAFYWASTEKHNEDVKKARKK